jgi:hypothetical protein
MALSEEQKQNIIEEETLRMEARRNAIHGGCCKGGHGHGHCCGKWGWIVAAILAVMLIISHCHHCCGMGGWRGQCSMGPGMGMPPNCQMMNGQQAPAPAPVPAKK